MAHVDLTIQTRAPQPGQLLARGVCRMLASHGFVCVEELVPTRGLRVDVMALGPKGDIWIVECKSSRADFTSDAKWDGYLEWADRFFWAVDADFPVELLPDDTGLKTEDYPFTAPLYLYTPPRRLPRLVREFVAYFESAASERLVRQAGFVSQTITASPLEDQGRRLAQAILAAGPETNLLGLQDLAQAMAQSARLSSTIRFADGSSEFDTQSRASISRLARALERGEFDGRRLVFVGFSDGAGAASANLRLSVNRAEAVAQAVRDAAFSADLSQVEFSTQGFGEALPMACDDTAWGRAVNRRVEVWLQ